MRQQSLANVWNAIIDCQLAIPGWLCTVYSCRNIKLMQSDSIHWVHTKAHFCFNQCWVNKWRICKTVETQWQWLQISFKFHHDLHILARVAKNRLHCVYANQIAENPLEALICSDYLKDKAVFLLLLATMTWFVGWDRSFPQATLTQKSSPKCRSATADIWHILACRNVWRWCHNLLWVVLLLCGRALQCKCTYSNQKEAAWLMSLGCTGLAKCRYEMNTQGWQCTGSGCHSSQTWLLSEWTAFSSSHLQSRTSPVAPAWARTGTQQHGRDPPNRLTGRPS